MVPCVQSTPYPLLTSLIRYVYLNVLGAHHDPPVTLSGSLATAILVSINNRRPAS